MAKKIDPQKKSPYEPEKLKIYAPEAPKEPTLESDFETWYKNQYGTTYDGGGVERTPGMSDYDYRVGANLLNHYGQKKILDAQKSRSQQEAAITYQKLLKYLPEELRAQGLGTNVKASESAQIDAADRYSSGMSQIGLDYAAAAAQLDAATAEKNDSIWRDWHSEKLAAEQELRQEQRTAEANARSDERSAYTEAMSLISSGAFDDEEALQRYLDSVAGSVSDEHYAALVAAANGALGQKEEKRRSGAYDTARDIITSGVYSGDQRALYNYLNSVSSELSREQYTTLRQLADASFEKGKKQTAAETFETAKAQILSGAFSGESLDAYLESVRKNVTSEQFGRLLQYADAAKASEGKQRQSSAYDMAKSIITSGVYSDDKRALYNYLNSVSSELSREQYTTLRLLADQSASDAKQSAGSGAYSRMISRLNNDYYAGDREAFEADLSKYKEKLDKEEYDELSHYGKRYFDDSEKAEKQKAFERVAGLLDASEGMTTAQRKNILERYKEQIDEDQYKDLSEKIDLLAESYDQQAIDEDAEKAERNENLVDDQTFTFAHNWSGNWENEDGLTIESNGKRYDVEIQKKELSKEVLKVAKTMDNNTVFIFRRNLFIKHDDDEVYKLQADGEKDWKKISALIETVYGDYGYASGGGTF